MNMKRKSNTLKKQKASMTYKKEEVKGKKEEVLPSTANTISYQPCIKWSNAGKRRLFLNKATYLGMSITNRWFRR